MPTNKKRKDKQKKAPKAKSVDDLIQAADAALLTQNPQRAIDLYRQASTLATADPFQLAFILEQSAHAKLSIADQEGAQSDYGQALAALTDSVDANDSSHLERIAGLHLYIGQLMEGTDALQAVKKGIDLLETAVRLRQELVATSDARMRSDGEDDDPVAMLQESKRQLSSALCNAADLFLTDLCYEENAEQECETFISMALEILDADGEPSVDALQTATSLRLSQNRGLEAADYILRVYERMRNGCEGVSRLLGLAIGAEDEADELSESRARELADLDDAQSLPDFEFRIQTTKLLLECTDILKKLTDQQERAEESAKAAVNVLGSLLAENDEVVEVCYLLGEAFASLQQVVPALQFYERAREMLASIQQSIEEELAEEADDGDGLQQQLDAVTCQLEECSTKVEELEERLELSEVQNMEE